MDTAPATSIDSEEEQRRIINRLKRLEGQIRGLQQMIDTGKDCEAILTQVTAAKSALNQVGLHLIGYTMKHCLIAESDDRSADEIVDEAMRVFLK
ncbi:MAG TPA: metal-sensitive transcriptional regulator, partial [Coriobacteriia bacterium]|nr:metal-sensitive transcriptional regulator [Coriobacteriia bacterium]